MDQLLSCSTKPSSKDVKGGISGFVGKAASLFEDLSSSAPELNEIVNQLRNEGRA